MPTPKLYILICKHGKIIEKSKGHDNEDLKYDLLSKLVSGEIITVPKTRSIVNYYQGYVRII